MTEVSPGKGRKWNKLKLSWWSISNWKSYMEWQYIFRDEEPKCVILATGSYLTEHGKGFITAAKVYKDFNCFQHLKLRQVFKLALLQNHASSNMTWTYYLTSRFETVLVAKPMEVKIYIERIKINFMGFSTSIIIYH